MYAILRSLLALVIAVIQIVQISSQNGQNAGYGNGYGSNPTAYGALPMMQGRSFSPPYISPNNAKLQNDIETAQFARSLVASGVLSDLLNPRMQDPKDAASRLTPPLVGKAMERNLETQGAAHGGAAPQPLADAGTGQAPPVPEGRQLGSFPNIFGNQGMSMLQQPIQIPSFGNLGNFMPQQQQYPNYGVLPQQTAFQPQQTFQPQSNFVPATNTIQQQPLATQTASGNQPVANVAQHSAYQ